MPAAANNTDLLYLEEKVKITFTKHAERDRKKLTKQQETALSKKCEKLEMHTWHQVVNTKRETGLTPERKEKGDTAYTKTLGRAATAGHPQEDIYPFHFRATRQFRVFGYQYKETFYITELDTKHKTHKRK